MIFRDVAQISIKTIVICSLTALNSFAFAHTGFPKLQASNSSSNPKLSKTDYTLMDFNYNQVMDFSRQDIKGLIDYFNEHPELTLNQKVTFTLEHFTGRPYGYKYAEGEGDWFSPEERGALHIQQSPVYRTDQFVCNTLVQTVMAVVLSQDMSEFNRNIVNIEYGAADDQSIHFYNRNNFISGDFNPVNQKHGYIKDVTASYPHNQASADIDRMSWFRNMTNSINAGDYVNIIDSYDQKENQQNGENMSQRFLDDYPGPYHVFTPEKVSINYIPKSDLVIYGNNSKNDKKKAELIHSLPTPSVVEVVRDAKLWNIDGKNIKDIIGTELNVSHLGMIYRKTFKHGQLIYKKISCSTNNESDPTCNVTPVYCSKGQYCHEVMYAAATDAYPKGYHLYQLGNNSFSCTAIHGGQGKDLGACNQVMSMPLGEYFASIRDGKYVYMDSKSILGMNIEQVRE